MEQDQRCITTLAAVRWIASFCQINLSYVVTRLYYFSSSFFLGSLGQACGFALATRLLGCEMNSRLLSIRKIFPLKLIYNPIKWSIFNNMDLSIGHFFTGRRLFNKIK